MKQTTEYFEIVDANDNVIGRAPRSECHGDPTLVHRAAHVLVFNGKGELLLQKRSMQKDIQPGRWDSSVGGHLDPGENYRQAAVREMAEELGIVNAPLTFLYPSRMRNEIESENIETFLTCYNGEIRFAPEEIDAVRFWSPEAIEQALGNGEFTPNFEQEWSLFCEWRRRNTMRDGLAVDFCRGDSLPDLLAELKMVGD